MAVLEMGRVCIISCGADKGKEVVIKETVDQNFMKVVGKTVKERRINAKHLEPTSRKEAVPVAGAKEKKAKAVSEKKEAPQEAKKDVKIVAKAIEKAMAENKVQ